ncbi:TonB-dependent receptor [uncultured Veillonella sp.]|uniref:TonB-dependent receptor n=1 Tax=uncultured Veillonella sp. TaxID=159268 RepID=UPI00262F09EE|nr:TonB-dependent receptor [uncultured Veillonella sp.]
MKKISALCLSILVAASVGTTAFAALPQYPNYTNVQQGQIYGQRPSAQDMSIAGVTLGTPIADVIQSLGAPSYYNDNVKGVGVEMTYGGITYGGNPVQYISVTNRDATTYRGIAVGDKLEKVYEAYGRPDMMNQNNWFYGQFKPRSGYVQGISFRHDGYRVTRILITNGD